MNRILWMIALFIVLPLSAQNHFVTVDWQDLPPVETLPIVTRELPLPDDFRSYNYEAVLEFPEFVALEQASADSLTAKKEALPDYPRLETNVVTSGRKGFLFVRFVPVVFRNGTYQRIQSFKLSLVRTPVTAFTRASRVAHTEHSVLSSGKIVKIRVADSGVYGITHSELKKMGFSQPDKVRLYGYGGYRLPYNFADHPADDLPEVPLYRRGESVLFYARGTVQWVPNDSLFVRRQNFYSNYAYYFLIENDGEPIRFPEVEATRTIGNKIETFNAYALYEKDAFSWADTGAELYDSYDYVAGKTQNYPFKLSNAVDGKGYVTVAFSTNYKVESKSTKVSVKVNGTELGPLSVGNTKGNYYTKAVESTQSFPWKGAKSEATTITLTHECPSGVSGRLNYLAINYQQRLQMNGSFLTFRSLNSVKEACTFVISGANASTVVWDVTSPAAYQQMKGVLNGSTYTFSIPASKILHEFVAVNTEASFATVENCGGISNQNLHGLKEIEMVIITPGKPALQSEAERLAKAHRDKDGMTVQVVTANQVYNEFSSGTPDATAYRRLMKMLYERSATSERAPRYLLLFGDAAYDNRLLTSSWGKYKSEDLLLSFQSGSSVFETGSYCTDDYFGFLKGDTLKNGSTEGDLGRDVMDIGVGRFPVTTAGEAKIAVDKTIRYMENTNTGDWKRVVGYVTDHPESGFKLGFMQDSEALIKKMTTLAPFIQTERIYPDTYKQESSATGVTYPEAKRRLSQLFKQGMLVVNYAGHSSPVAWSETNLLTSDEITKLSSPHLPLWVTASCEFSRFDASATSAGELAFLNENGGAIALYSTTRAVNNDPSLNQAFHKYLFDRTGGKKWRLGDVMRLAKQDVAGSNKLNFILIGDPALALAFPDYEVKVDEFGDAQPGGGLPQAKAGGKITVKGHILTPDGEPANDFTGTVHPLVLDSEERITTLGNTQYGTYTYTARTKSLYNGIDSVRNGRFEFSFPVPLDINYSDKTGLLNIYACDEKQREAGGIFDRFLVGGTVDDLDISDADGPKINMYLNKPDFSWGGQVNETPYFVADLEDEDGINTVGSGIGHDLSLCIDGRTTYSLNDYYIPEAGSYTKGKVAFSIPALSEGKHNLTFRAWDILNRSSVKTLDFEVVKGLCPDLFSIICSVSPAREGTTFILSHDRPGSILSVRIAVCDFSGRELWVHTEEGASAENYYYVDWDLCSNAGQRLSPGVYLYRASIISEGSKESTQTEKIVILAQ